MEYTGYTEKEWSELPKKYHREVIGLRESGEIIQPPLCPECGSEMANIYDNYLSCTECGAIRKLRVLRDV